MSPMTIEMPPPHVPENVQVPSEEAARLQRILSRAKKMRPGQMATLVLGTVSALLLWGAFPPLDVGQLAWVCLAPWLVLARLPQRTAWMYRSSYLAGCVFWVLSLQWMRLGDPTMILAWLALAFYLACYWPLALALTRVAVNRLRLPLVIAAPLMWTGLEYLRGHLITGFSWYQLAHTQHRWVNVIQVSDLFGGYAVTFVVVAANAALAMAVPLKWIERAELYDPALKEEMRRESGGGRVWRAVACAVALLGATLGYGLVRHVKAFPAGPRVALIQGNFVASLRIRDEELKIYNTHRQATGVAVAAQPDVVIWPEAMFPYGMQQVEPGVTDEQLAKLDPNLSVARWRNVEPQKALSDLSEMTNAAMIIGLTALRAHADKFEVLNSAVLVQPGMGMVGQYDKIHRVPFGEYIPLRDQLPFLQSLTPFRGRFGIDAGTEGKVFQHKQWRFIPTICFEDTVPHLVRELAHSASVNDDDAGGAVLVNISNDGWFHGSSELDQHLISSKFRAVETRTPLVRAANTGISAVIDGDGIVREPAHFYDIDPREPGQPARTTLRDPKTGRFYRQLNCAQVTDVPLDPRSSFYVATGDWFAAGCLVACCAAALSSLQRPPKTEE